MHATTTPIVPVRPQDLGLIRKHWAQWTDRGHGQDGVSLPESRSFKGGGSGGLHLPAVNHDGPGFGRVEELDLADKAQEASGIAGDAVVGPAGEVEEAELPDLVVAFLRREWASVPAAAAPMCPSQRHGEPRLRH